MAHRTVEAAMAAITVAAAATLEARALPLVVCILGRPMEALRMVDTSTSIGIISTGAIAGVIRDIRRGAAAWMIAVAAPAATPKAGGGGIEG